VQKSPGINNKNHAMLLSPGVQRGNGI